MSIIIAERIAKSYDPYDIFWDVSCSVAHGDRIALVGRNGTGKTTLLCILAGFDQPTGGHVRRAKGLRIGFLPQEATLEGDRTLWQEMMTAFEPLRAMEARLHDLEAEMADPARADEALVAYAPLREQFEDLGGYTYEERTQQVLIGLGFPRQDHHVPLDYLSGGQKTRATLARLLLESPDLLLLDEPTNHLDLQAIEWLEGYLNNWEGTVVLVAHDRYFMDRVVHKVWDLTFGGLDVYSGNYSHYARQRAERYERRLKEYRAQQEFIAKEADYIQRYIASERTRQAQGRLKRLERFKEEEAIDRPRQEQTIKLRLQTPLRSGDKVLWTQDLAIGYDRPNPLFHCPDLDLRRGECVALLGPNGSGKTTFLKTVLGQQEPLAGYARLGASLKIGYYAQVHTDLDPDKSVLDTILEVKNLPLGEARTYLARYLFTGDDVFKRIGDLSGGERSRVALAKLVMLRANFLLLDEPTNHLDIASQEVLEGVLDDFPGTILLVTHDRYLVDRLASQLWIIEPDSRSLRVFKGTWAQYAEVREQEQVPQGRQTKDRAFEAQRQAKRDEQRARREREAHEQRLTETEAEIHHLEQALRSLEDEIAAATAAQEAMRLHELGTLYAELQSQLQAKLDLWAEMAA
ncbi:MAG: ABC-F family ATP-binding cassette domain-containing protein [Anaerolineae bacterium]|nr:ABC-F family ATP-binding cassette domain-containing protein [Anaerolineae bacterium]